VPLDLRGPQRSIAWRRVGDHLESISVVRCGFMRLRGAFAGPEPIRQIGLEPRCYSGRPNTMPWTKTRCLRRWHSPAPTCPAAFAPRPKR
jgi:hypothetical protein